MSVSGYTNYSNVVIVAKATQMSASVTKVTQISVVVTKVTQMSGWIHSIVTSVTQMSVITKVTPISIEKYQKVTQMFGWIHSIIIKCYSNVCQSEGYSNVDKSITRNYSNV